MTIWIEMFLSVLLAASALALTRVSNTLAIVVLLSVYSGLLALLFAVMGAIDVAFTEAVVGAGVSTIFFMALLHRVDPRKVAYRAPSQRLLAWLVCLALGAVLVYGINTLPDFGSPTAPAAKHVAPYYIAHSVEEMETPNVVTAVLGDYRSLDTLIEAAVVLTAALGCLLVSGRQP